MSLIQTPWTSQPQQAVEIDWSNPITRLLDYAVIGGQRFDVCNRLPVSSYKNYGPSIGGMTASGAIGYLESADNLDFTLVAGFNITGSSGGYDAVTWGYYTSAAVNSVVGFSTGAGTGTLYGINRSNASGATAISSASYPNRNVYAMSGKMDGATAASLYTNGVFTNSIPKSGSGSFSKNSLRKLDVFSLGTTESVTFAFKFSRILSPGEIRSISQNPWQIFKPTTRRIFVPVAAAGGGTTAVTSDHNASYSITGSVAADASAAYAIRAAVTADATAIYALRAAAQADQSAAYAIRAAVASDLASSYAIQTAGTVTTGLDAAYAVRGSVAGDISVGYQIAAAVQAEVAAAYAVRAAVQNDLAAGYAIQVGLSAVSADLIAAYAVDGSTTTRAPSGAGPSIILPGSTRPGSLQTSGRPPNLGGRRH